MLEGLAFPRRHPVRFVLIAALFGLLAVAEFAGWPAPFDKPIFRYGLYVLAPVLAVIAVDDVVLKTRAKGLAPFAMGGLMAIGAVLLQALIAIALPFSLLALIMGVGHINSASAEASILMLVGLGFAVVVASLQALSGPLSFHDGRLRVLKAWRMARGNAWPMLALGGFATLFGILLLVGAAIIVGLMTGLAGRDSLVGHLVRDLIASTLAAYGVAALANAPAAVCRDLLADGPDGIAEVFE